VGTGYKPNQCRYLANVRREASRHFRYTKKEYLRAKMKELETKIKIKKIQILVYGYQ
jgi:hypothetical protein